MRLTKKLTNADWRTASKYIRGVNPEKGAKDWTLEVQYLFLKGMTMFPNLDHLERPHVREIGMDDKRFGAYQRRGREVFGRLGSLRNGVYTSYRNKVVPKLAA